MGAQSIIMQRGVENPLLHVLRYIYNEKEGPLKIGSRTWINLNDELKLANFVSSIPPLQPISSSWKPAKLPKLNDEFFGIVTSAYSNGDFLLEIYLHDVCANPKLEEIQTLLNNAYNGTEPTNADLECQEGNFCIAR